MALLCGVLNSMSAHLNNLLQSASTLDSFSSELLANKVISTNVESNPSFAEIMREFQSSMTSMSNTKELEELCRRFLQALGKSGGPDGPTSKAAANLGEEWSTVILNKMGIHFIKVSSQTIHTCILLLCVST